MSFHPEVAKRVLLQLGELFDTIRLPFFLLQGTALGAYRDNGFVPTEKDIDIGFIYEHFAHKVSLILDYLHGQELVTDLQLISAPFTRLRTLAFNLNGIHVDLVSFIPWQNKRFASRPLDERNLEPYAIVHNATILEEHDRVNLWGRYWNVPSPIEDYLRLEYGRAWRKPKEDHVSRTRIYDYCEKEGIPDTYLESLHGAL